MMDSQLLLGNMSGATVIRVIGRGTMQESPAFRAAAEVALEQGPLVCDMSDCEYLDSTFLGCLVGVRKLAEQLGHRFDILADANRQVKLFTTSSLDKFFDFIDQRPPKIGEWMEIEPNKLDVESLSRHVLVCHERLAERGGEDGEAFQRVVNKLLVELEEL